MLMMLRSAEVLCVSCVYAYLRSVDVQPLRVLIQVPLADVHRLQVLLCQAHPSSLVLASVTLPQPPHVAAIVAVL